jgi:hypothetical protein
MGMLGSYHSCFSRFVPLLHYLASVILLRFVINFGSITQFRFVFCYN